MNEGIPTRVLSELTGVAPTTLRAWERRYALLSPQRTTKGHRLYSPEDVALIKNVVTQLQGGMSIGEAVRRQRHPQDNQTDSASLSGSDTQWPTFRHRMLQAVELFDEARLDACYNEALSLYPFGLVSESLITPVLMTLGERWQQRPNGIIEVHFFTAYLRNKLGARLHHETSRKHGSLLLVSCLPMEFHEIGTLLFAIEALAHGYRLLYLGPNSPLAQLPAIAERAGADASVLSGTSVLLSLIEPQWSSIQQTKIPTLVGGPFSTKHALWLNHHNAIPLGYKTDLAVEIMPGVVPPYRRSAR